MVPSQLFEVRVMSRFSCIQLAILGMAIASVPVANGFAYTAAPETVVLWPNGAPDAKGNEAADRPRLTVHLPEKPNGAAMIVCPGGGYRVLAMVKEGHQVAQFFNTFGVTAFVLEYRLGPKYQHPAQLHDAQRAIRYVRADAAKYGIDPKHIGIMGFSAGGHLTAMAGVYFDNGKAEATDPIDRVSCRPDFLVLAYPKIFWQDPADSGGLKSFLGDGYSAEAVKEISADLQVKDQTPPAFLFHTDEDRLVAENSVRFYLALRQHKVPAEIHIYQKGPHGVGLALDDPDLTTWKDHVYGWMKANAWLTTAKPVKVSGEVTVNGRPLERGFITFIPDSSLHQPTVKTAVNKGKYELPADKGPRPGKHTVAITVYGDNMGAGPANDLGSFFVLKTCSPKSSEPLTCEIQDAVNELRFEVVTR
jgi:acetyl esterase/lipase